MTMVQPSMYLPRIGGQALDGHLIQVRKLVGKLRQLSMQKVQIRRDPDGSFAMTPAKLVLDGSSVMMPRKLGLDGSFATTLIKPGLDGLFATMLIKPGLDGLFATMLIKLGLDGSFDR